MASAEWLKKLPEFFIARFPFFNAISLLLLLAERAKNERYDEIIGFVLRLFASPKMKTG